MSGSRPEEIAISTGRSVLYFSIRSRLEEIVVGHAEGAAGLEIERDILHLLEGHGARRRRLGRACNTYGCRLKSHTVAAWDHIRLQPEIT